MSEQTHRSELKLTMVDESVVAPSTLEVVKTIDQTRDKNIVVAMKRLKFITQTLIFSISVVLNVLAVTDFS